MHDRLFARLGEQAVLRNTVPCNVNIERGVVVSYEAGDDKFVQSEYAAAVDVANIPSAVSPAVGDSLYTLANPSAVYVIDAIAADNGFMARCVLRAA